MGLAFEYEYTERYIMTDIDMKQKIKEVRDKFLSNNQIEDIRQNITLGVEERLKFLNSEQIKVVELLEEKHRDLDSAIKAHAIKIETENKSSQDKYNEKINSVENQFKEHIVKLENENTSIINKYQELRLQLDKDLQTSLESHEKSIEKKIAPIIKECTDLKKLLTNERAQLQTSSATHLTELAELSSKNLENIDSMRLSITKNSEKNEIELTKKVDQKISVFEKDKEKLFVEINAAVAKTIEKFQTKIEDFIKNHATVEDVIDSRLTEFRTAQKSAFEELEAALNLLERHQDDTINRFKNQSEAGFTRSTSIRDSITKNRNRGSILHQANGSHENSSIISNQIDVVPTQVKEKSGKTLLKTLLIFIVFSLCIIYGITHFEVNLQSLSTFLTQYAK